MSNTKQISEKEMGVTIMEVGNIQDSVSGLLVGKAEMDEVMNMLIESIEENPRTLKAVLVNYIMLTDMFLNTSPEEMQMKLNEVRTRRGK